MAKDKKKKKDKKKEITESTFTEEYDDLLKGLRIKHEQYDGLIKEAKLYLDEVKELREKLRFLQSTIDNK